jgi:hypothetical protein
MCRSQTPWRSVGWSPPKASHMATLTSSTTPSSGSGGSTTRRSPTLNVRPLVHFGQCIIAQSSSRSSQVSAEVGAARAAQHNVGLQRCGLRWNETNKKGSGIYLWDVVHASPVKHRGIQCGWQELRHPGLLPRGLQSKKEQCDFNMLLAQNASC